jgi:DUF971 family protein
MNAEIPSPSTIILNKDSRGMSICYKNGVCFDLPAEYLRVLAPSADVQGHGGVGGKLVHGKRDVKIKAVERVGNYAVRIIFSDGHKNGIYTWKTLMSLGVNQSEKWADYLAQLEGAGKSRDKK